MSVNPEMIELVEAFMANEAALAAYYAACVEKFPENREKWGRLQREEEYHADIFRQIRASVEAFPTKWRLGRYQAQTVRLICTSVREKTKELLQGKLNPRYAVTFIVDVENSLIESNISRSLETEVSEFQQLLTRVQEDTISHKQVLQSMTK